METRGIEGERNELGLVGLVAAAAVGSRLSPLFLAPNAEGKLPGNGERFGSTFA